MSRPFIVPGIAVEGDNGGGSAGGSESGPASNSMSGIAEIFKGAVAGGGVDDHVYAAHGGVGSSGSLAGLLGERRRSTPDGRAAAAGGAFAPRLSFEQARNMSMSRDGSVASLVGAWGGGGNGIELLGTPGLPRTASVLSASLPSDQSLSNMCVALAPPPCLARVRARAHARASVPSWC